MAVGRQGVWRSNDFGGTWSLSAIPVGTWGSMSSFHDVRISRANPDVIYAGSRMDGSGQMHRSADGGVTFTPLPNYTTVTMGGISGLATHPTDANTAYVLFGFAQRPKILRTTNGGASWSDITGFETSTVSTNGFPDVAVYDLVVFSSNTNRLWAATEIGLVESLDGGATWALANNGLPNVGIWFLTEVEDQIVAGTHGRGIWSVTMPELIVGKTFKPLIDKAFQRPDGQLEVKLNLRSAYDTTTVFVNGSPAAGFGPNAAGQLQTVVIPVVSAGLKSIHLGSSKSSTPYNSVTTLVDAFAPKPEAFVYQNDFETATTDFTGTLFTIGPQAGFPGNAIHSPHPYADGSSPIYTLTVPIRVAQSNADVEFDEVVLVEPGDPGSVFGDSNFWDFVIVEGSTDGCEWKPLLDGYDSRAYPEWETAYYANNPSPALFRHRSIDMLHTFQVNDLVLIRFRLYADGAVTGWGWVIDNLAIQLNGVSSAGASHGVPALALRQNAPNPFRSATSIAYTLPSPQPVSLAVFDVQGRLVRELVSGRQPAGDHSVTWDGRDSGGREAVNGMYFYRLSTAEGVLKKKLTVMR